MAWITIVLSPSQHADIKMAAAMALKGASTGARPGVSTWARPILVKAAKTVLEEASRQNKPTRKGRHA